MLSDDIDIDLKKYTVCLWESWEIEEESDKEKTGND